MENKLITDKPITIIGVGDGAIQILCHIGSECNGNVSFIMYNTNVEPLECSKDLGNDDEKVIVVSCLGGDCGNTTAPVVVREARKLGKSVMALLTLPFSFEGSSKYEKALESAKEIESIADMTIMIQNQYNMDNYGKQPIIEAYRKADEIICRMINQLIMI